MCICGFVVTGPEEAVIISGVGFGSKPYILVQGAKFIVYGLHTLTRSVRKSVNKIS